MLLEQLFIALLTLTDGSCGGGGDSTTHQLYFRTGSVVPNSALVTSTCVPNQSTPAPNTDAMCFRQVVYGSSLGQRSEPSYIFQRLVQILALGTTLHINSHHRLDLVPSVHPYTVFV